MSGEALRKLTDFFEQFKPLFYKKGEVILRPEDVPYGVSLLKAGYIKYCSVAQDGEELTLIILKPGDPFPIMWAINDTPNTGYLEAMTKVEIRRSPKNEFLKFIKTNPDVLLEVVSKILARFGGILQRMEHLAFGNAYEKTASILLICAERFGKKEGENIVIQVPLTHQDIANLIGLTRETTSIEMEKLAAKKFIGHKKRLIVIRNKQELAKEAL